MTWKKKRNAIIITILLILVFFVVQGLVYGWFFPPKPAVVVYLASNTTEILGFTYAKHPGSLMCIACDGFYAKGEIIYDHKVICTSENGYIGLGETYMPLLCPKEIKKYEGKTVTVNVIGSINNIKTEDSKTLKMEFKNKDEFRS